MKPFRLDRDKFDNLVHYIIWKCPDPAKLGSVKLHKILWKADASLYRDRGSPITGATYRKRPFGPATDELLNSRDRLRDAGKIRYWTDSRFAGVRYAKSAYEAVEPPATGFLNEQEKQAVDYWINEICLRHTAKLISEDTHGYAWDIAEMGEELPLYSIFVERISEEPDKESLEWAKGEARRLGLLNYEKS